MIKYKNEISGFANATYVLDKLRDS